MDTGFEPMQHSMGPGLLDADRVEASHFQNRIHSKPLFHAPKPAPKAHTGPSSVQMKKTHHLWQTGRKGLVYSMKNLHHGLGGQPRMKRFGLQFEKLVHAEIQAKPNVPQHWIHPRVEMPLHGFAQIQIEQGIQGAQNTKRPRRPHPSIDLTEPASLQGAFECEQRWKGKMLHFLSIVQFGGD